MSGTPGPYALEVLWTGDREVAVEKPAGLSSERPSGSAAPASSDDARAGSSRHHGSPPQHDSAITRARAQFGWPDAQLPHRLDRPTSGILVVAADRARASDHAREMREGRWCKWYVARIAAADAGSHLLGPHRRYLKREGRLARCVRAGGDPSSLEVLALEQAPDRATDVQVLVRLDTGRFHQIRVMFADLGAPLLGDVDYGGARARASLELISCGLRIARDSGTVRIVSRATEAAHHGGARRSTISPALVARLRQCMADDRAT